MIIKDGYNSKPTSISLDTDLDNEFHPTRRRMAGLNIEQEGVSRILKGVELKPIDPKKKYKDMEVVEDAKGAKYTRVVKYIEVEGLETRALLTLDELLDLRDICNEAIRELVK